MELQTLEVSTKDHIGRLRLARPEKRNAINLAMLEELVRAVQWLDGQSLQAVVVEGADGCFCAGVDLDSAEELVEGAKRGGPAAEAAVSMARAGELAVLSLRALRAPTVCKLERYAIGGGALLAAACDFRVMEAGAYISIPELELGTPLVWGGVPLLIHELGVGKVRELTMLGRRLAAKEAHALGFAAALCADGEAEQAAAALLDQLVPRSRVALGMTKAQISAALGQAAWSMEPYLQAYSWGGGGGHHEAESFLRALRGSKRQ